LRLTVGGSALIANRIRHVLSVLSVLKKAIIKGTGSSSRKL